jgi:hypothetical protein
MTLGKKYVRATLNEMCIHFNELNTQNATTKSEFDQRVKKNLIINKDIIDALAKNIEYELKQRKIKNK